MEELIILKFQVEHLENTLRLVANTLGSRTKETCLDREVMKSIDFVKEVLSKSKEIKK